MQGSTHTTVAVSVGVFITATYWGADSILGIPVYPLAILPTVVAGGLKADMDMKNNPQAKNHPVLSKFLTHRGLTHTAVVALAFYLVAYMLATTSIGVPVTIICSLILGFFLGYASHIFIDMFNYKGCPMFWPLVTKRFYIMRVTTGTWQESVFLAVWTISIIVHLVLVLGGYTL